MNLYKTDITLRWTITARLKGVCLKEDRLYSRSSGIELLYTPGAAICACTVNCNDV